MNNTHNLIREIQAIAQTGLQYTKDPFDRERYQRLRQIAFNLMSLTSDLPLSAFEKFFLPETGYATPKVDLRACAFNKEGEVLLVQELTDGRWSLPGGWADPNEPPTIGIAREVAEEAGYTVKISKLYAIKNRQSHPYTPIYPVTIYKLFFLAEITEATPHESIEITGVRFFPRHNLPPLSQARILSADIDLAWQHLQNPHLQPYID